MRSIVRNKAKRLHVGVALAMSLLIATAVARSPPDGETGNAFPKKFGPAELVNTEDFEVKTPGLGQVGQYTFQGWRMSMYVYDNARKDLAEVTSPAQIKPELDAAVGDILEAKKLGHYSRVDEGTAFAVPPTAIPPIFRCRAFVIQATAKQGAAAQPPYDSYMCVTTSKKRFVKLRFSSTTPAGDQATVFTPVAAAIELAGRMLQR